MSDIDQQSTSSAIKILFQNQKLTGFDIAKNTQISNQIKRDSTDFSTQIVKHKRGKQIVCELIDIALRPRILINHLKKQKENVSTNLLNSFKQSFKMQYQKSSKQPINIWQTSKQTTNIIYNAIQILTNQYEQFVKFIFQDKPMIKVLSSQSVDVPTDMQLVKSNESNQLSNDSNIDSSVKQRYSKSSNVEIQCEEDWDDCVIMDGNFPQLTKNQQDQLLNKINSSNKLSESDMFQSEILDRMFMLFEQPAPIQQTPVSYFNKIILQFVYQKPEQIMRFFYCEDKFISKKSNCQKIRKLASHLYNNSIIQLLVHIMQLQNQGNFYIQQKIQILKTITEQVFKYQQKNNPANGQNKSQQSKQIKQQTSTMSDMMQQKITNYILILKSLYEKLQDRYQQQKYLNIFKTHLNDCKLLQQIVNYFLYHFNYFDNNGLITLLIQILKMDQVNFKLHKSSTNNSSSPFGENNNFSFHNKNQQSSIASYDLKLSTQILDQIQKVISVLSKKYQQWQGSTIRMIQYYQLIHCWLNITIKDRQNYAKKQILTTQFINECLFKMQSHQKSTILHNSIKNIIVDFLPKIQQSIKIIISPQCQLIDFIENYLQNTLETNNQTNKKKSKKNKKKCYQNQLYHIGKVALSIWQQHKMLNVIKKTQDDQQDCLQKYPTQTPSSPTSDQQIISKFQKLKMIITKKQQFYDHLICGDPRKMDSYQQQQSSQIIMTSSFKNFFKPTLNNLLTQTNNDPSIKVSKDRYDNDQSQKSKNKKQVQDLKKQTNLKTDPKYRNLKLGDQHANSLFQSAISPLNANKSHTFNFDLPLDSDHSSEQAVSEQQDLPQRKGSENINSQMKLLQQNIQNFQIIAGNVLGVQSNILSSSNSINNQQSLLAVDNYRRQQLSKSIDIKDLNIDNLNMDNIAKVDSYLAIQSPRKPSEDDVLSLGLDSKQSGSKLSQQNQGSKIQNLISQNMGSFLKDSKQEQEKQKLIQTQTEEMDTLDSNFVRNFSSYLNYDLDKLCTQVE